jgi:hypothetical protein
MQEARQEKGSSRERAGAKEAQLQVKAFQNISLAGDANPGADEKKWGGIADVSEKDRS